jgi:hypothetical protein
MDAVERIEQLALVLVDALDLDVEESIFAHSHIALGEDNRGKLLLILQFHGLPLALQGRVVRDRAQRDDATKVAQPLLSLIEPVRDDFCEAGIALVEPATCSNKANP